MTILIQTRASRLSDVLTNRDVNEIADTQAGTTHTAVALPSSKMAEGSSGGLNDPKLAQDTPVRLSVAKIGPDGKVKFEETDDFSSLSR